MRRLFGPPFGAKGVTFVAFTGPVLRPQPHVDRRPVPCVQCAADLAQANAVGHDRGPDSEAPLRKRAKAGAQLIAHLQPDAHLPKAPTEEAVQSDASLTALRCKTTSL